MIYVKGHSTSLRRLFAFAGDSERYRDVTTTWPRQGLTLCIMAPVWKEEVQVEIVRFVEECQPNIVEARFSDSEGRCHTFIDKSAIFSTDWSLDEATKYPQPGVIRCQILARWQAPAGPELVRVTTEVESTEGVSEFVVLANQVSPSDSHAPASR